MRWRVEVGWWWWWGGRLWSSVCGVCVYVWGGGPFPHNEAAGVVSSSRDLLKPELCRAALDREEKAAGAEPASAAGAVVYVIVFKCNPPSQTPHPNSRPPPDQREEEEEERDASPSEPSGKVAAA